MIAPELRVFHRVSGVNGEGVSFRNAATGQYIMADGDKLIVGYPVGIEEEKQATFIEEPALGEEPAWSEVYPGDFYSYRAAGTENMYITHTGEGTMGLTAVDAGDAEAALAATFKLTGDQSAQPTEDLRGGGVLSQLRLQCLSVLEIL